MSNRHFLVVGGTKGTGLALVRHLVEQEGVRVSVFGRSAGEMLPNSKQFPYAVDVTNTKKLLSCLNRAVALEGKFSCVIFMQRNRSKVDSFNQDLAVALSSTKNTIEHLIKKQYFFVPEESTASIVLVSSIADQYIAPEQTVGYHVIKAGFVQLARYYAHMLGPSRIRVNCVSPCVVAKEEAKAYYEKNWRLATRFNRLIPLGRMGASQDIINTIQFLVSQQASYITGQNIVVDGGLTLRSHESLIRDFPEGI